MSQKKLRPLVIDTSALTALFDQQKSSHSVAVKAFANCVAIGRKFVVPALVVYEIRRGLLYRDSKKLLGNFDNLLNAFTEPDVFDRTTAEIAALLWSEMRKAGSTKGEIDLLILACAVGHNADIITYDTGFPSPPIASTLTWEDL